MKQIILSLMMIPFLLGCNGNNTNKSDSNTTEMINTSNYILSAWNDLGMHCMDGKDFSVFSILPPYNNIHAQLKNKSGTIITSGVIITYEASIGTDGKWNTTTNNKTNFWDFVGDLFGATNLSNDVGLTGNPTTTKTPIAMKFNSTYQWWEAEGIPISPYNDDGTKNYYPLAKIVAKDSNGNVLAEVETVLPISDEMDCKRCHYSNSENSAEPTAGWVNNDNMEKDYKLNILRLHDQNHPTAVSDNSIALANKGYTYDSKGLEATVDGGVPILCAACHKSNALPNVGIELKPFTEAIHSKHANVIDPNSGLPLNSSLNRSACYSCHPGAKTKCLRGAMGNATDSNGNSKMQCQNCHGDMNSVGSSNREGWLDQPNCQACHYDGKQEISAIDSITKTLRAVVDNKFATNPDTPTTGFSLYRFSKGHGNLQCEACHGSTHAIYPAHEADNKLSKKIQGHIGTIGDCTACHTSVPNKTTGGPHGMHPVGSSWVRNHQNVAERHPAQCKVCHGSDYRGSVLSKMWTNRTKLGSKFIKGHQVSCYDCHNGPNGR